MKSSGGYLLIFEPEVVCDNHLSAFLKVTESLRQEKKFVYVPGDHNLISNLSLKENLLLEGCPGRLRQNRQEDWVYIRNLMEEEKLGKLVASLSDWEKLPHACQDRTNKMLCLIKALVAKPELLFLDYPEKHLGPEEIKEVCHALQHLIETRKTQIYFATKTPFAWRSLLKFSVQKNGRTGWQTQALGHEQSDELTLSAQKIEKAA